MVIYENLSSNLKPSAMYVTSQEVRNRKRFGICASPSIYNDMMWYESPVQVWLNELQSLTEVESLSALQAKSVATTPESFEALSIRNAQIAIQQIRSNSSAVIDELDSLIDSLPVSSDALCYLLESFSETYSKIHNLIEICRRKGCDFAANKYLSTEVTCICEQTIRFMKSFLFKNNVNNAQIEANVRKLKESFGQLVDVTIKKECTILVSALNKKTSHLCLKWSLFALWQLTQRDPYMCRLFVEHQNIIRNLLDIVQSYCNVSLKELYQIKAAALRVLTYLCANRDAVKQILDEIVSNKCLISMVLSETEEIILKETVGLLVQITTPFIDSKDKPLDSDFMGFTSKSLINELVNCLTEILKSTQSDQIFLMSCAALANISFMNTECLVKFETVSSLINACKQRQHFDQLLLKDQVITLLANLSQKHPLEVVSSGGLIFLLNSLISDMQYEKDESQVLAVERIQQKIAVALARLGAHKSTAKIIYRLNGVSRLIQLCKEPRERNYSDTVLLACIAALKRISQSIGKAPFKELHATDLIECRLQDTFLHYSAKNESLV